jgi:DNA-binding response OmpR family regulator
MRILVIEDYVPLRRSLVRGLREEGYAVDEAADGDEGLAFGETGVYDVIILDIMLPRMDGFTVLKSLRDARINSRVLVLTAKDTVEDRVHGLDTGADDYLVKPFDFSELAARVRALQRRKYRQTSPLLTIADLEIDTAAKRVRRAGHQVELTAREYSILEILASRRGEVVSRDEIAERIYDFDAEHSSNVVDVYIGYLRKKLETAGKARLIHTRRGLGYVLDEEP